MPRQYKRQLGSRHYADYLPETLQKCLDDVQNGVRSQRDASDFYKVPRSTIKNKLKKVHSNPIGHPTVFTREEEECFVQHLITLSDFGFPVDELDLRMFIKSYLDAQGKTERRFRNNIPGIEFARGFLKRHKTLTHRFSTNTNRARLAVNKELLTEYINHLRVELEGIPPSQIWNYDETNLTDDPGKKKVICRRGSKYVEHFTNHSKVATSVMFCGNADGSVFLPPYVVYKAEHIWSTWQVGGPPGTRYSRSKSGWFDSMTFEDWYVNQQIYKIKSCRVVKFLFVFLLTGSKII